MFHSKKGQLPSGSNAAVLVAILTLIIILYVLFLPPGDREDLLNGDAKTNDDSSGRGSGSTSVNGTFFIVHPGTMDVIESAEIEHNIPSFSLAANIEPTQLRKVDSFAISTSLFSSKKYETEFTLRSPQDTSQSVISFNIRKGEGTLTINLNGKEIYSGIPEGTLTIPMENGDLIENNTLSFSASGVGMRFWASNEYIIEGLTVVADILDRDSLESKSVFMITSTEKSNLESSSLKFYIDCITDERGRMTVKINGKELYSSRADCGSPMNIEVAPKNLNLGENEISFKTDSGSYLIDQIAVNTDLKKIVYPTYFFKIGSSDFEDIEDGDKDVVLSIEFADDVDYKKGSIYVNGHLLHLDQRDLNYTNVIDAYLIQGNNAIELIPKTRLNILTIKAEFEDN